MTAQTLDRVLTCYRIGDPDGDYPIFDAMGSRLYPGRWNTPACPVINTSDWALGSAIASKAYGDEWQASKRSLLLIVPSVVAQVDRNFLINPEHPQFGRIKTSLHEPIWWDSRLFR